MALPYAAQAAEVKNPKVWQEGGRMVIEYDLDGKPGEETEVTLVLTIEGKAYKQGDLHLEGEYGKMKAGGGRHRIYWNGLQDFPRGYHGEVEIDINAGGGVEELKARGAKKDNGDGTVTDYKTGLTWQQQDDVKRRNWNDAISYCKALDLGGHKDWRLPSKDELASLVDKKYKPTIDPVFINTQSSPYWSSTTTAYNTSFTVPVYFGSVKMYATLNKTNCHYVRCVR